MKRAKKCMNIYLWGLAALLTLGFSAGVYACPIPVFQYSLEYWPPDPYEVVVHYDGELREAEQKLVDMMQAAGRGDGRHANISVMWRDHSVMEHSNPEGKVLPRVELRYPSISGIRGTLWEGPLEEGSVEDMLHSPLREKIAEKLLSRKAGVWVLLESGNRSEDRRARRLLEEELPRMEETLKVPDPAETYGMDLGDIYTDIDFSMITLSRDDPEEQMFIRMLLGIERDLDEYEHRPIVFPIYGRGLAMYALIGDGINEWTLNAAGEFLTGPCSCQVKQSNPGVDILMSVDWEGQVERRTTYGMPGADTGGFIDRMDEAEERLED